MNKERIKKMDVFLKIKQLNKSLRMQEMKINKENQFDKKNKYINKDVKGNE